ncbi:hypothetical protein MRB53_013510 [Persea americana]|uniref:Uncharacterized protein n=1 Tax=Persea americana TaxID=3435 RepID=A0ACC2K8N8_PERAE|nr:hypothetical protein MRB53_013510 [Persea americana]
MSKDAVLSLGLIDGVIREQEGSSVVGGNDPDPKLWRRVKEEQGLFRFLYNRGEEKIGYRGLHVCKSLASIRGDEGALSIARYHRS